MDKRLKKKIRRIHINRAYILALFCIALSSVLIHRLYTIQILNGEDYRQNFSMRTTKTRNLKSTRGNIYDRNGRLLATNELSYSLTIEDSGTYPNTRDRDLRLNAEAYRISKILQANGDSLSNDFHVIVDSTGQYAYDCTGRTLDRFKADVYGHARISDLTPEEANATPDQLVASLTHERRFGVIRISKSPFSEKELLDAGLPTELTKQEILDIVYVRFQLFTTQYRKYMPVTIAKSISEESVAALNEEKDTLIGIDIVEDTKRVYSDPIPFASLIGYTGKVSSEDLAMYQSNNSNYNSESVVGKSGIEKSFEILLQGSDGQETVFVDNLGKVLQIDKDSTIQPTAGGNVYLTIDADLQIAAYKILEQRIAGVLRNVIVDQETYDNSNLTDTEGVRIPITDVYNAVFENGVLDISHFEAADATETELEIARIFNAKQQEVFAEISDQLMGAAPLPYNQLTDELKEYESYIVNNLLTSSTKVLDSSKIDKADPTYLAWTRDETISLKEYLTYAVSQNWIDISSISEGETYLDSAETYELLSEFIEQYLSSDEAFSKTLYKYLISEHQLGGKVIVSALYDQGIFDKNDGNYENFIAGGIDSYDLIGIKIDSLELTPAMLALDPCSGSIVITNPNSGEILACVTYPGYDNNRLANKMDAAYYNKLAQDQSRPFYNKATQQETAPGSTFKLITTTAGLEEKAITIDTVYNCDGTFAETETPLRCWLRTGHGPLNIVGGIENSCNVFFCNVAYVLGTNEEGNWSDSLSLSKLQQYANLYNMDKPSGIEVPENTPHVSDQYAIQSSIGQGTHAYTTTQLARYVTSLANGGTSYNISMVDKVTDAEGNIIRDYSPEIESIVSISNTTWATIHEGMRNVLESKTEYEDLTISVAGKTGTAQESKSRPSHALFVCYAPYENPEIAMAVRIGNGYSSTNCAMIGKDILQYYFHLVDESEIITGTARTGNLTAQNTD